MGWQDMKQWLGNLSMRRKLTLMNLITSGVVVTTLAVFVIVYTVNNSRQALEDAGFTQLRAIAENLAPTLMFQDEGAATEALATLARSSGLLAAAAYDVNGRLFSTYGDMAVPARLDSVPLRQFREDRLLLADAVEFKGERYGTLLLLIDTKKATDQIVAYTGAIFVAAMLTLLVGIGVASVMNRFITGNLDHLTQAMHEVTLNRDFSLRATDITTTDEIGSLARSFDAMLERVEAHEKTLSLELDERRRAEEMLHKLAYFDTLTQLPNRQFFNRHLEENLQDVRTLGGSLALMFIDLDNFKSANDNFGHHVGDELLKLASTRLSQTVRGSDIVCRLGGDEFAVVIKEFRGSVQVETVATKINAAMAQPFHMYGHDMFIGASIGIALAPDHAVEPNELVRCADTAMYRAKESGKNKYAIWHVALGDNISRRYRLENNLRKALERRELEVHFQPVHGLPGNELAGMEALLRWHSGDLGTVSPVEFIPLAEECGLIDDFGIWVFDQACRHLALWRRQYPHLYVAVNVSAHQFLDANLPARFVAIIDSYGLPHDRVEIEITESLLLDPTPVTIDSLMRLHELGIPIALDDFGTGYSSLSYLSRFPISKIKIDRSFIATLGKDDRNMAIVSAIIGMGNNLGMKLHVEGIESPAYLAWLSKSGCTLGQGFHYSCPLNAQEFERYVHQHASTDPVGKEPLHV